jgi:hypothetical protein
LRAAPGRNSVPAGLPPAGFALRQPMEKKYTEELFRYPAVNEDGKPCEVIERITYARTIGRDGRPKGRPTEVNRRWDLKTGERLHKLSDTEFMDDESGARITLKA